MAVREGQILARLDDSTQQAALHLSEAQAEAARRQVTENEVRLAEAKLTLRRRMQLLKDQLSTQAEVDQAQAEADSIAARIKAAEQQVAVAERQIALQKTDLDNTIIRAPFSGVALSKDAQPGEVVSPVSAGGGFTRTGIGTIVDMSSLEIEVDVNESFIQRVRPAQAITATLQAYPEWKIPGHVITTVPTADRQKATVQVRIAFDELGDPRILPEMGAKVVFLRQGGPAVAAAPVRITVPQDAIVQSSSGARVWVVSNQTVSSRAVQLGPRRGDRIEVMQGLSGGETVVLQPPPALRDGAKVRVATS